MPTSTYIGMGLMPSVTLGMHGRGRGWCFHHYSNSFYKKKHLIMYGEIFKLLYAYID